MCIRDRIKGVDAIKAIKTIETIKAIKAITALRQSRQSKAHALAQLLGVCLGVGEEGAEVGGVGGGLVEGALGRLEGA
eukprot:4159836-Prymnesium_polylepis.1